MNGTVNTLSYISPRNAYYVLPGIASVLFGV